MQTNRRQFIGLTLGGSALAAAAAPAVRAQGVKTKTTARIVILGAGAAGTALANQLAARLDGAKITIIDARKEHYYQPGFTLIGAGLKPAGYSVSTTAQWLPREVEWIEESAAEIDPEGKSVTTASGSKVAYDYLLVATGLRLAYEAIEGMSLDLIGKDGIGSIYAGPDYAAKTWAEMDRFTDKGGMALFSRPATEMKCAGAPLKYTFLTDDYLVRKGTKSKSKVLYAANNKAFFSVPIVSEKVRMLYEERGIDSVFDHVMKKIDPARKIATFATPDGDKEIGYDFTHVIPPMYAPDVVKNSPLPWTTGPWVEQGWAEVNKNTMRHVRYPEVFAVGDIAGVPKGKTAASVKWQVPVVVDQLAAQIEGTQSGSLYHGYTSCPLITRVGRAMLVEFDYNNNLVPSFPGIIAPLEELWISWLMKEIALKATYNAMLRGKA